MSVNRLDTNLFVPYHSDRSSLSAALHGLPHLYETTLEDLMILYKTQNAQIGARPLAQRTLEYDSGKYAFVGVNLLKLRDSFLRNMGMTYDVMLEDPALIMLCGYQVWGEMRAGKIFTPRDLAHDYSKSQVFGALGIDPTAILATKRKLVNDVFSWVDRALEYVHNHSKGVLDHIDSSLGLCNSDGLPLLGVSELRNYSSLSSNQIKDVLRGIALFGVIDDGFTRKQTRERFPLCLDQETEFHVMGCGVVPRIVHSPRLNQEALKNLRRESLHEHEGFVYDPRNKTDIENQRIMLGLKGGVSDIGGLVYLQIRYGTATMLGGMIADGMDNYNVEVKSNFSGCMLYYLSQYVQRNYKSVMGHDLISEEEVTDLVYLAAKQNTKPLAVSESHIDLNRGELTQIQALSQYPNVPEVALRKTDGERILLSDVVRVIEQRMEQYERYARAA